MKTDLKLCDRDGDGEKSVKETTSIKYNPRRGIEQSSPPDLLKCEETRQGRL